MADKQKAELEQMKKRRKGKGTLQDVAGDYLIPDTSDGLKPEKAAPETGRYPGVTATNSKYQDRYLVLSGTERQSQVSDLERRVKGA